MNKSQYYLLMVTIVASIFVNVEAMHQFCSNVPNGRFVSSPRSCQHWIFCQNQQATEGQCPDIFYFDMNMQMCRYPSYVNCQIDSVPDVTCPVDVEFELQPHPQHCDQYIACVNGFPRVVNCAPGLHWNRKTELCDLPANADCVAVEEPLDYYCDPTRTYLTHHPHDCQQFILCVNGDRRVNRCAENLVFDPVNHRCDFPENVQCANADTEVLYECDATRDFYMAAHPTSCQSYIFCISGIKQVEYCADGLHFDAVNLRCDMPENAMCEV